MNDFIIDGNLIITYKVNQQVYCKMNSPNQILDSNLIFNMMPLKSKQDLVLVQDLLMKQIEHSMQLCKSIFMPIESKIIITNQKDKNNRNKGSLNQQGKEKLHQQNKVSRIHQKQNSLSLGLDASIFMQLQTKFFELKSVLKKVCFKANQMQTILEQEETHYQERSSLNKQERSNLNKQQELFVLHILKQVGLITQKIFIESPFFEVITLAKQKYQKINSNNYLQNLKSTIHKHLQHQKHQQNQAQQLVLLTQSKQNVQFTMQCSKKFVKSRIEDRSQSICNQSTMDIRGYTQIKPQNSVINKIKQSENQVKNIIKNWEQNIKLQN